MSGKRTFVIASSVLSSMLLLAGALLLPWWSGELEGGRFEVDLRHMRICLHGACGDKALSLVGEDAIGWSRLGVTSYASSLVGACLLLWSAWSLRSGGSKTSPHWLAGVVALFAGLMSVLFIWLHPNFGQWSPSYGMASGLAGAFLGALAGSAAARVSSS